MDNTTLDPGKRYEIRSKRSTTTLKGWRYVGDLASGELLFEDDECDVTDKFNHAGWTFTPIKEPRTATGWVAIVPNPDALSGLLFSEVYKYQTNLELRHPEAIDYMEITWTEKVEDNE